MPSRIFFTLSVCTRDVPQWLNNKEVAHLPPQALLHCTIRAATEDNNYRIFRKKKHHWAFHWGYKAGSILCGCFSVLDSPTNTLHTGTNSIMLPCHYTSLHCTAPSSGPSDIQYDHPPQQAHSSPQWILHFGPCRRQSESGDKCGANLDMQKWSPA